MNHNDLVAMLQEGRTMEDIANEMTAMLNKAQKEYEDQKAKELEANKVAEAEKNLKAATLNYMRAVAPELFDCSKEELAELEDMLGETILEMTNTIQAMLPLLRIATKSKEVKKSKSADDVIADFLRTLN